LDCETRRKFISDIYMREDVSVQSAAKQDTIIVDGQLVAKRYMLLTVAEAYETCKNELIGKRVSRTTFFRKST